MSSPGDGKRQRTEGPDSESAPVLGPINLSLLTPNSRERLHDAYEHSGPYKHGVLRPLCEEASLRGCFDEMQAHLTGTFKETDLFKACARLLLGGRPLRKCAAKPQTVPAAATGHAEFGWRLAF